MPPENPPAFSFDENSADAAEQILGTMPEVQQHAIDQHETQTREAAANVEKDSDGVPFDATIHTGTKLKSGQWRKRKVAGNPGSTVAAPRGKKNAAASTPEADASAAEKIASANAAGAMAAASVFMLGRAFGGKEWEPSPQEVEMQAQAWGAYFLAKDITDFPPGMALCIAIGAYAGPRFQMPETKKKMGKVRNWIALRIARRKIRAEFKKRGIEANVHIKDGQLFINDTLADAWKEESERA